MSTGHYGYCSNCGLELPPTSAPAHQCPIGFANMYLQFLGGLTPAQVRMIVRDECMRMNDEVVRAQVETDDQRK